MRSALGKLMSTCRCKSGPVKAEQAGRERVLQASR